MGGEVIQIKGKTDQRIEEVLSALMSAEEPLSYDDLRLATGGKRNPDDSVSGGVAYDVLLYVLSTLVCVGLIEREERVEGPGRPRVFFSWIGGHERRVAFSRV